MSDLHIPEYTYLVKHGIEFPAVLVQHALEAGLIHLPQRPSTIPRCPIGKKAAAIEQQKAKAAQKAAEAESNHHYNNLIAQALQEGA